MTQEARAIAERAAEQFRQGVEQVRQEMRLHTGVDPALLAHIDTLRATLHAAAEEKNRLSQELAAQRAILAERREVCGTLEWYMQNMEPNRLQHTTRTTIDRISEAAAQHIARQSQRREEP